MNGAWWVNCILKGKAEQIYRRNAQEIGNDFDLLIKKLTLNANLEVNYSKMKQKLNNFRYVTGMTLAETLGKFIYMTGF